MLYAFLLLCTGIILLFVFPPAGLVVIGLAIVWMVMILIFRLLRGAGRLGSRVVSNDD